MEWPTQENNDADDAEADAEDEVNEVDVVPCADPTFRQHLIDVKHELYERVVYGPDEGTEEAQDLKRLQEYLLLLNRIYLACVDAQRGRPVTIDSFPSEMRKAMKTLLARMEEVRAMSWEDRIPYVRMVEEVLHEDPFVQN